MKTKRFLSTLLALLLVCSLPVSAFAEDIGLGEAKEETIEDVGTNDGYIGTNYHTVTTNTGDVTTNTGTVTNNNGGNVTTNSSSGTVTNNNGEVTTNNGKVTTNNGIVETNKGTVNDNNGTVKENQSIGTVGTNTGTVDKNYGTVTNNGTEDNNLNAKVNLNNGTVTTNNGTVVTNGGKGTVTNNNGTVCSNNGTVTNNNGTVDYNHNTIETNNGYISVTEGQVKTNNGTVGTNAAVVIINNGTVTDNQDFVRINNTTGTVINVGGDVLTNYGTVKQGNTTWYGVLVDNDGTETLEEYCEPNKVLDFSQLTKEGYVYAGYTQEYQLLDGVLTKQALTVNDTSYTVTCPNVLTLIWQAIVTPGSGEIAAAASDGTGSFGPGSLISINGHKFLLVAVVEDVYCLASVESFEDEALSDLPALLSTLLTEEQLSHVTGDPELLDEALTARFFAGQGSHIVFPCDSGLIFS